MKRRVGLLAAVLVSLFAAAALAESITGVIVEDGRGSIRVKDDGGQELRLFMDRGMRYVPEDYRALEGDRVTVTYEMEARKRENIAAIREIKMESIAPANALPPNPAQGKVVEVGRKAIRIHLAAINREISFDMMRELGTPPLVGDEGMVSFRRVPSRFGNGYVYQITGFAKK